MTAALIAIGALVLAGDRGHVQVDPLHRRRRGRVWSTSASGSRSSARTTRSPSSGEAGYQAELLMPGLRFKLWPIFAVKKFPWVQVPGRRDRRRHRPGRRRRCRSAPRARVYQAGVRQLLRRSRTFVDGGGAEGRAAPGAAPRHARADPPGRRSSCSRRARSSACRCRPSSRDRSRRGGMLTPESFGLTPEQLQVVVIAPQGDDRRGRHRHHARRRSR